MDAVFTGNFGGDMPAYRTRFQIRDLEEFTGVKAHTIRMWEKRYGLLRPDRTDTNIRTYGLDELKALLNVAYLNRNGYRIRKIAELPPSERDKLVRQASAGDQAADLDLNTLKVAMLSFDEELHRRTVDRFRERAGFRRLVEDLYVPLLEQIGMLWQTSSICPGHEHFTSNLIRQDLIAEIASLGPTRHPDRVHVLFLPENEIHDLGLLYLYYLLKTKGERCVYLGESVPTDDLAQVAAQFDGRLTCVVLCTVTPHGEDLPAYLRTLTAGLPMERCDVVVGGGQTRDLRAGDLPEGVRVGATITELTSLLDLRTIGSPGG